jgi:hypothetical protein
MYLGAISQHNITAIQPDIAIDISADNHTAAESGYVPSYFTLDFNCPSKRGEITTRHLAWAYDNGASKGWALTLICTRTPAAVLAGSLCRR